MSPRYPLDSGSASGSGEQEAPFDAVTEEPLNSSVYEGSDMDAFV